MSETRQKLVFAIVLTILMCVFLIKMVNDGAMMAEEHCVDGKVATCMKYEDSTCVLFKDKGETCYER